MLQTAVFAVGASLPLTIGALLAVVWRPPKAVLAAALAFASGALICAVSFELFLVAHEAGGIIRVGAGFAGGALTFVIADCLLERRIRGGATGFALLAGVTLDGVPENVALGVSLVEGGTVALLVAVFASNFPEALAGAETMLDQGRSVRAVVILWLGATVLLAAAVVLGRILFAGVAPAGLALPLAFAAGAVLASVVDTLAPEAFRDGGPAVALASALGFVLAYLLGG